MKFLYLILFVQLITANVIDQPEEPTVKYRLPAEWEPHERTIMAWPRLDAMGDDEYLDLVRQDIANLANAIADFEPVIIFANPGQVPSVQKQVGPKVKVVGMMVDDFWARDTSPVFVSKMENGKESIGGIVFNFNGWGNKQAHRHDGQFARRVLELFGQEIISTPLISEGGACQADGQGTLLAPRSSLINKNRNNQTVEEIEIELKRILGIRKIVWFDSVEGEDMTDGHIDCLVRYIRPGEVFLDRPYPGSINDSWAKSSEQAFQVLSHATDADGNPFRIVEVFEPDRTKITRENPGSYVTSYLNFYIGNGFVAVPAFGDFKSDLKAQKVIQAEFPDRKVMLVSIDAIASGGGGIHCSTHQHPAVTLKSSENNAGSISLLATSSLLPMIILLLATLNIF